MISHSLATDYLQYRQTRLVVVFLYPTTTITFLFLTQTNLFNATQISRLVLPRLQSLSCPVSPPFRQRICLMQVIPLL
jgi:hypothetical protein